MLGSWVCRGWGWCNMCMQHGSGCCTNRRAMLRRNRLDRQELERNYMALHATNATPGKGRTGAESATARDPARRHGGASAVLNAGCGAENARGQRREAQRRLEAKRGLPLRDSEGRREGRRGRYRHWDETTDETDGRSSHESARAVGA